MPKLTQEQFSIRSLVALERLRVIQTTATMLMGEYGELFEDDKKLRSELRSIEHIAGDAASFLRKKGI